MPPRRQQQRLSAAQAAAALAEAQGQAPAGGRALECMSARTVVRDPGLAVAFPGNHPA